MDDLGNVVSIVAGGLDITERHRLEAEKERERAFLNAIANNAPSLLCLVDEQGRLTAQGANIAFERTLERDPSDIGGEVFWMRYAHPSDADEVRDRIERVIAGDAPPTSNPNLPPGHHGTKLAARNLSSHSTSRTQRKL